MRFLPKANPLYEKIPSNKIIIPDVLEKLGKGGFTGYFQHTAPDFEFYGIFAKGKLLCALSSASGKEKTGFEAIVMLFDKVLSASGEVNVYRMTADLAVCAHASIIGTRLFSGDEVRNIDIKSVFVRIKGQSMNGVVRFYTNERYGMMFYKEGAPIGFYHDSAASIESSPDESRKIAGLPGARVEICSTRTLEELMQYDLLQMVNLQKLWESAKTRIVSAPTKDQTTTVLPVSTFSSISDKKLLDLVDDISEVASAYLSKAGRTFVEKRIKEGGGPAQLLDATKLSIFLAHIEKDATDYDSNARIDEMIDLMKSEIAGRLAV
ncbi:MAG: GTPase-activating protein [Desulfuromonadaceae bacterium]|nr:GTPase-activating protein [Desulfuromonadaceae bacterium]MDD2854309.1 GTPase-activating protein [Desulfuromonadaceae bacterium]